MKIQKIQIANVMKKQNINNLQQQAIQLQKMNAIDSISFTGSKDGYMILDLTKDVAESLTNSTSGHRDTYIKNSTPRTKGFTKEMARTITGGFSSYLRENNIDTTIIGGDEKEATTKLTPGIIEQLLDNGVNVYSPGTTTTLFGKKVNTVATPMLALAAKTLNVDVGILLTSSHNPKEHGGFNFVNNEAAIAPAEITKKIGKNMVKVVQGKASPKVSDKRGELLHYDPMEIYKNHLDNVMKIDFDAIKNAGIQICYDGLEGVGTKCVPELYKDYGIEITKRLNTECKGPNPTEENLQNLAKAVKSLEGNFKVGLSNDGDVDRLGIIDENGKFISANDTLLLVLHHMVKNRGVKEGYVIKNQATSPLLDLYAKKHGIEVIQTPVGFKYIGEKAIALREEGKDIIVAGEESGGLTVAGHIPEKDGILGITMILELMAKEKKPVGQILKEIKEDLPGAFEVKLTNMKVENAEDKDKIVSELQEYFDGKKKTFAGIEIDLDKTHLSDKNMRHYKEGGDGIKLYLKDGSNVLVRKSGTENKVKAYINAFGDNQKEAKAKFEQLNAAIVEIGEKYNAEMNL